MKDVDEFFDVKFPSFWSEFLQKIFELLLRHGRALLIPEIREQESQLLQRNLPRFAFVQGHECLSEILSPVFVLPGLGENQEELVEIDIVFLFQRQLSKKLLKLRVKTRNLEGSAQDRWK